MHARRLLDDSTGVVLPYVAITLGVIIGLAALALDGSRLMNLQTQLQNAADALALAGAAELDRRPDSMIRAQAAVQNLLANPVTGAGVRQVARVRNIIFLRSLPGDDALPTTRDVTEDPTLAAYIEVDVEPIAVEPILAVSLSASRVSVGAQAIAGYDQIVCDAEPVFVCNPFETSGMSYFEATQALVAADRDPAAHRQLLRLAHSQSKNGGYGPGDFGYLMPATGYLPVNACGPGGGRGIPQALAVTRVRACYRLSTTNLVSGDDKPVMEGLNTRFDIYAGGFSACRIYAPDLNVRKGFVAPGNTNWCNATPATPNWPMPAQTAPALPVDQSMTQGQSLNTTVAMGNGIWNCAAYWSAAHYIGPGKNAPPPGCTTSASISRYDVYRYELNFLDDRSLGAEFGGPRCAPPGAANRRIITMPIINCGSSPVPVLSDAQGVPAAGFGRFFLVLPAERGTNGNPYAEFLGLVKRTDPVSSDMVQLNR